MRCSSGGFECWVTFRGPIGSTRRPYMATTTTHTHAKLWTDQGALWRGHPRSPHLLDALKDCAGLVLRVCTPLHSLPSPAEKDLEASKVIIQGCVLAPAPSGLPLLEPSVICLLSVFTICDQWSTLVAGRQPAVINVTYVHSKVRY